MTSFTIDQPVKLKKNHFKNINELFIVVNFTNKTKKLTPLELINKYNLAKKQNWKSFDITKEINNLAYNI